MSTKCIVPARAQELAHAEFLVSGEALQHLELLNRA